MKVCDMRCGGFITEEHGLDLGVPSSRIFLSCHVLSAHVASVVRFHVPSIACMAINISFEDRKTHKMSYKCNGRAAFNERSICCGGCRSYHPLTAPSSALVSEISVCLILNVPQCKGPTKHTRACKCHYLLTRRDLPSTKNRKDHHL